MSNSVRCRSTPHTATFNSTEETPKQFYDVMKMGHPLQPMKHKPRGSWTHRVHAMRVCQTSCTVAGELIAASNTLTGPSPNSAAAHHTLRLTSGSQKGHPQWW